MTTLLLVRHGETEWNRQGRFQGRCDIPLNDEGRAQAQRLAEVWDRRADLLLASPLARAWQTAEILGSRLGLVPRPEPRVVERSYGQGEGLTMAERRARWGDSPVPDAETLVAIQDRARRFLDEVTAEHPGRTLVVVSHGGFINAALAVVSGGELGSGKTLLGNASLSEVVWDAQGGRVVSAGLSLVDALGLKE